MDILIDTWSTLNQQLDQPLIDTHLTLSRKLVKYQPTLMYQLIDTWWCVCKNDNYVVDSDWYPVAVDWDVNPVSIEELIEYWSSVNWGLIEGFDPG